jgi:uncharacterized protein (TIGR00251 family)
VNHQPTEIRIKAVPGASRDALAGMLGDRLKVRVSAPPEGGKANKAIAALLARELGVRPAQVEIISGHTSPEKTVRVTGCDPARVRSLLGEAPG